ncbi:hypothetical protein EWM64_g4613 [Hericium alpestre]|uniref:HSF-type DNA-binding domain-containing protein n=1 Tax=Hericium alpestre TaxID=135208 RepID=A0A4Y9ZYY8_9AGAM|nr:hypothetical protein EWM64_g4613 [Hericium alpestre]
MCAARGEVGLRAGVVYLKKIPCPDSPPSRLLSLIARLSAFAVNAVTIPSLRPAHFDEPMADIYPQSSAPPPRPPMTLRPQSPPKSDPPQQPKSDSKPQATFLTKLYALLERSENHHMIRWDPAGEHIIVERPEQLALHVLPSIYRQSRFASFSRQLNIYGFMRKVNLRNVDPAIDDPDASTWSHPTLNRHSPADVVANFKRRVPPRLPKPRKRPEAEQQHPNIPPPRSAVGLGTVPYSVHAGLDLTTSPKGGRARGFSAPGSYNGPLSQPGAPGWAGGYPRSALPPLTVPSDPPMGSHGMYNHSPHALHPISPSEDTASTPGFSSMPYSNSGLSSSQYPAYQEQNQWSFSPVSSGSSSHSGSLSSLLNPPSSGYPPARPTINTSYPSSISSVSMQHSASSLSPDSRPATGYSVSSISSLTYEDGNAHHYSHDYSRPGSGHPRPLTPTSSRPPSSKGDYSTSSGSLSIRRQRRHSQAMNPYPSAYEQHVGERPSSSPQPPPDDHSMHRSRSMIQLPTVDNYGNFAPSQSEFAYGAPGSGVGVGTPGGLDTIDGSWNSRSVRPSTSASSLSAASQTSSSQAHTPPVTDNFGETDIHRFTPDFGFLPMNEHVSQYPSKTAGRDA